MANDINIVVAAQVQGALAPLKQVEQQVGRVGAGVDQATQQLRRHSSQYSATSVSINKFAKGALQQLGFQIGDYAVQVANGTSKMQAFGQQGSQVLGIFGPIGAVLGAGVAIFSAFAVAAERAGKASSTFSDAQGVLNDIMSNAQSAVSILEMDVDELAKKYGDMAFEVRQSALRLMELSRIQAASALAQDIRELDDVVEQFVVQRNFIGFGRVATEAMENIRIAFRANSTEAGKLADLFAELVEVSDFQGQKAVLAEIQAIFKDMGVETLPPELARVLVALEQTNITAAELETLLSGVAFDTSNFADEMERAARAVQNINVKAFERLQQLRAEASARVAGAGDEAVRVQRAVMEATREARERGINGPRQLRLIAQEASRLEQQIIAEENRIAGSIASTLEGSASRARNAVRSISPELDDIRNRMQQVAKAMDSGMEGAFMSIVDGTKSVKDAFRSMAADIIKELYRVLVVQRLVAGISGAVGGFFNLNQVSGPAMPLGTGSIRPMMRAQGGAVSANSPYIVGEKGPEMLVPGTSGRVIPNNQLNGGGNGVTIVQNISISTGVQQTVRAEIKQLMPQIAESAKSAVVDAKRRGGSYGRAFA
jgi:hypothetical protein